MIFENGLRVLNETKVVSFIKKGSGWTSDLLETLRNENITHEFNNIEIRYHVEIDGCYIAPKSNFMMEGFEDVLCIFIGDECLEKFKLIVKNNIIKN